MAIMDIEFLIEKFRIEQENESSDDEPYLIPVFIVFDRESSPTPLLATTRRVRIHAPGSVHGNLGSQADGLVEGKTMKVPAKTGRFATRLATLPGFLFNPANAFTFVALLVIALEEDDTSGSAINAGKTRS